MNFRIRHPLQPSIIFHVTAFRAGGPCRLHAEVVHKQRARLSEGKRIGSTMHMLDRSHVHGAGRPFARACCECPLVRRLTLHCGPFALVWQHFSSELVCFTGPHQRSLDLILQRLDSPNAPQTSFGPSSEAWHITLNVFSETTLLYSSSLSQTPGRGPKVCGRPRHQAEGGQAGQHTA